MNTDELVVALTVIVQRVTGRRPTSSQVVRAGRLIQNALEIVNPDSERAARLARSLAITFEIAAQAADVGVPRPSEKPKTVPRGTRRAASRA